MKRAPKPAKVLPTAIEESRRTNLLLEELSSKFRAFGEGLTAVKERVERMEPTLNQVCEKVATIEPTLNKLTSEFQTFKTALFEVSKNVSELKTDVKEIKERLTTVEARS